MQVVAAGSSFGEMALHFIEKYKMMAVRIPSKLELRRFCRCSPNPSLFLLVGDVMAVPLFLSISHGKICSLGFNALHSVLP